MEEVKKYHRPITHQGYKYTNKIADFGSESWLPQQVCEETPLHKVKHFKHMSENYMVTKTGSRFVFPIMGGCLYFLLYLEY